MAIDQDTLNVLKRIEGLLQSSSRATGVSDRPAIGGSSPRTRAAEARAEEASEAQTRKIYVSTGKAVDRLGYSSNRSAESLIDFNRKVNASGIGLGNLSGTVTKAITQISSARTELGKVDLSGTLASIQRAVDDATNTLTVGTAGSLPKIQTAAADFIDKLTTVGSRASSIFKPLEDAAAVAASTIRNREPDVDLSKLMGTLTTLNDTIEAQTTSKLSGFGIALGVATAGVVGSLQSTQQALQNQGGLLQQFGQNINVAVTAMTRRSGIGAQLAILERRLKNVNNALRGIGRGGPFDPRDRRRPADTPDSPADVPPPPPPPDSPDLPDDSPDDSRNPRDTRRRDTWLDKIQDPFKIAFTLAAQRVVSNAIKVIDEAFQTTGARGFGTLGTTFARLSWDAAWAGMSLQEYAKVLDENEGVVSRMTSFSAFNEQLDVGRKALAQYGIFGLEATRLTASMVGSAQTLGVPVEDLSTSIHNQMTVFEQLRKTTGITAEQFEELNRNLQNSEEVQRELIGLDPREREARLNQLRLTTAWGRQLGLTTQESSKLTAALLAQRKSTVKERFNARGRLQQSMALVGMDPTLTAEAAALTSKRNRTTEEDQRLTTILGEYQSRAERIKQEGGPGMANAVEMADENLAGTSLKPLLDASIAVKAAQDSGNQLDKDGNQINKDLNQKLSGFEQFFGKLIALIEGLAKSPIFQLTVGAIGAGIALSQIKNTLSLNSIANSNIANGATLSNIVAGVTALPTRLATAIRSGMSSMRSGKPGSPEWTTSYGADGSGGPADSPDGKQKGKWGRRAASVGRGLGRAVPFATAAIGIGMAVNDFSNADKDAEAADGDVGRAKGEAIGEGIGATAGSIIGAALGSIVPGLGTAIGGAIGAMVIGPLGSWAGKLIGGWAGSEDASEKNAREVEKNTKELIKSRRATAASDVISTNNIAGLSSNLIQSAKAFAGVSEQDRKDIQDAVNKKNNTTQNPAEVEMVAEEVFHEDGSSLGFKMVPKKGAKTLTKPVPTTATPTESKPVEAKPTESKPVEAKPAISDVQAAPPPQPTVVTPAPTPPQTIATPVSVTPTTVNQGTVNTQESTTQRATEAATQTAASTIAALPPQDATALLQQIVQILTQSLTAENQQIELASQLLRSSSFSRLPDNQILQERAIRSYS